MRVWRAPLLILVAVLATFVWLLLPPLLIPARDGNGLPGATWDRIVDQTYYLSFGCGIVCGAALGAAFTLRSKRAA